MCVCFLALKKGHDINIGTQKLARRSRTNWREAPQTKRNEKTPNRQNGGRHDGKNPNCTLCTWARNYFWRGAAFTASPHRALPRTKSCIVFVFSTRCSTRKKFWSHWRSSSICVCVCVCLVKRLVQDFWKFLRLFWVWVAMGVGPLEAGTVSSF